MNGARMRLTATKAGKLFAAQHPDLDVWPALTSVVGCRTYTACSMRPYAEHTFHVTRDYHVIAVDARFAKCARAAQLR